MCFIIESISTDSTTVNFKHNYLASLKYNSLVFLHVGIFLSSFEKKYNKF